VPQTLLVPLPPQVNRESLQFPHSSHLPQLSPMRPQYCPPTGSHVKTHWTSNRLASKFGSIPVPPPPVVVLPPVLLPPPPVVPAPPLPAEPPLPVVVVLVPVLVVPAVSELQPWNMDQATTLKTTGIANRANLMASPLPSSKVSPLPPP
jgi:hypothetical protein